MSLIDHVRLLAKYNAWMNTNLYTAAATLPDSVLAEDRGAFFGSIFGTLNHITVADHIWLKRFFSIDREKYTVLSPIGALPSPTDTARMLFGNFQELAAHRIWLDNIISDWSRSIDESDLAAILNYANTKGVVSHKRFSNLLLHVFNH